MKYIDYYTYDKEGIDKLLMSGKSDDKISALIWTLYSSDDYHQSIKLVSRFLIDVDNKVRNKAIKSIGDLARIYGELDINHLNWIKTLFEVKEDYDLVDPLEDIWIFYYKKDITRWEDIKLSHPNIYLYFWLSYITDKYTEINPNKGVEILTNLLNSNLKPLLKEKVCSSIEYIELFRA